MQIEACDSLVEIGQEGNIEVLTLVGVEPGLDSPLLAIRPDILHPVGHSELDCCLIEAGDLLRFCMGMRPLYWKPLGESMCRTPSKSHTYRITEFQEIGGLHSDAVPEYLRCPFGDLLFSEAQVCHDPSSSPLGDIDLTKQKVLPDWS